MGSLGKMVRVLLWKLPHSKFSLFECLMNVTLCLMLIIVRLISDNINVPIKKAVFIHSVTTSSVNFTNNAQFSIIDEKNSHSLFLILKKLFSSYLVQITYLFSNLSVSSNHNFWVPHTWNPCPLSQIGFWNSLNGCSHVAFFRLLFKSKEPK